MEPSRTPRFEPLILLVIERIERQQNGLMQFCHIVLSLGKSGSYTRKESSEKDVLKAVYCPLLYGTWSLLHRLNEAHIWERGFADDVVINGESEGWPLAATGLHLHHR
jgi:hypothetical protein